MHNNGFQKPFKYRDHLNKKLNERGYLVIASDRIARLGSTMSVEVSETVDVNVHIICETDKADYLEQWDGEAATLPSDIYYRVSLD